MSGIGIGVTALAFAGLVSSTDVWLADQYVSGTGIGVTALAFAGLVSSIDV